MTTRLPVALAAAAGFALALLTSAFARGDITDSPVFFALDVPAGVVGAAVLAWLWPAGAWRYGLAYGLALCAGSLVAAGELGNLWPLSIAFFLVLSLPMVATGAIVGWWRRHGG